MPTRFHKETLSTQLPASEKGAKGAIPEWFHIIPAPGDDGLIRARDGRIFRMTDPASVIAETEFPLYLDRDHKSMMSWYGDTSAAGWFDALEWREPDGDEPGGMYARCEHLTSDGRDDLEERRYRRLSPTLLVQILREEGDEEGEELQVREIFSVLNVAMTNRPALRLVDLNRVQDAPIDDRPREAESLRDDTDRRTDIMHPSLKALLQRLGLGPGATEEQLAEAMSQRLDSLDTAKSAVKELEELRAKTFADQLEATISDGMKAGKILPATASFYRSTCRTQEDLENLCSAIKQMPTQLADDSTSDADDSTRMATLSAEEQRMAKVMDLTDEQMLAARES